MHQLFAIEHLVDEICFHAPRSALPNLARVSSTWFRCAISHLYGILDNSLEMHNALAPLGKITNESPNSNWKFANSPTEKDFERLAKYTPYVRALDMDIEHLDIVLEAMRKKVFSKGDPYLFPNARYLEWRYPPYSPESTEIFVGLISPKIDQLSLLIDDEFTIYHLCQVVTTRLSALRFLLIVDDTGTSNIFGGSCLAKPVQNLLISFSDTLTSVWISPSLNSPSIVGCLSEMPRLCNLTVGEYSDHQPERIGMCADSRSSESGFPSLRFFSFEGLFQPFRDMFCPYGLASLTTLSLNFDFTSPEVHACILLIAAAFPHMSSLNLGKESRDERSTGFTVPWSFIQPISRCKELTSLSLNGMRINVSVNLEELIEFLSSRTTWKRLHILTSHPLRLKDIFLFTQYCRNLEHLGIYLHGAFRFRIGEKDLPADNPSFSTLHSIDFADSKIGETASHTLAQLLCRICKKPPKQLLGLDNKMIDNISRNLANCYIDQQCSSGGFMSSEVGEFIKKMVKTQMPA